MEHNAKIDETTRRRAALDASCDPRTIDKVMKGEPVRGLSGERARAALAKLGIATPPATRWRRPRSREAR